MLIIFLKKIIPTVQIPNTLEVIIIFLYDVLKLGLKVLKKTKTKRHKIGPLEPRDIITIKDRTRRIKYLADILSNRLFKNTIEGNNI